MRHYLFLLTLSVILFSCNPIQQSTGFTLEDKGWTCTNATFFVKNKSKKPAVINLDGITTRLQPKEKIDMIIPKGEHLICINERCEKIKMRPCIKYDFTPELIH